MKLKNTLTAGLLASGLLVTGLAGAQVAGAQGYGSDGADPAPAEAAAEVDTQVVPVQTDPAPGEEAGGAEGADGERRDGRGCGRHLDTAAEAIGIDEDALRAELDAGQSIAEVAEANGVAAQTVIDAMVVETSARLDEKVAEGRLTVAEAEAELVERTERIEDRVFGIDADDEANA